MGIASLVCGILSLLFALVGGAGLKFVGILLGIAGIVLGVLGKKDEKQKGIATAGFVISIIGAALSLIFWIACVSCLSAAGKAAKEIESLF